MEDLGRLYRKAQRYTADLRNMAAEWRQQLITTLTGRPNLIHKIAEQCEKGDKDTEVDEVTHKQEDVSNATLTAGSDAYKKIYTTPITALSKYKTNTIHTKIERSSGIKLEANISENDKQIGYKMRFKKEQIQIPWKQQTNFNDHNNHNAANYFADNEERSKRPERKKGAIPKQKVVGYTPRTPSPIAFRTRKAKCAQAQETVILASTNKKGKSEKICVQGRSNIKNREVKCEKESKSQKWTRSNPNYVIEIFTENKQQQTFVVESLDQKKESQRKEPTKMKKATNIKEANINREKVPMTPSKVSNKLQAGSAKRILTPTQKSNIPITPTMANKMLIQKISKVTTPEVAAVHKSASKSKLTPNVASELRKASSRENKTPSGVARTNQKSNEQKLKMAPKSCEIKGKVMKSAQLTTTKKKLSKKANLAKQNIPQQLKQNSKNIASEILEEMESKCQYTFEDLHEYDSTDDEDKVSYKRPPPPYWSRSYVRGPNILMQQHVPIEVVDSFFSVQPITPDLQKIFSNIKEQDLRRNSSEMWDTPPSYSKLPKY